MGEPIYARFDRSETISFISNWDEITAIEEMVAVSFFWLKPPLSIINSPNERTTPGTGTETV